jgi:exonuclease III
MSWNVWGRTGTAADRQLAEVLRCEPDVLALQEVVKGSLEVWLEGLRPEGYSVIHSPIELLAAPGPYLIEKQKRPKRKNFNVTASRHPITALPGLEFPDAGEAFPEKHVATRVSVDNSVVDIHNTHLPPGSSTGLIKIHAFQAIRRRIDAPTHAARVLCGDFNAPLSETDTKMETAASRHRSWREEWDRSERLILEHPNLQDPYRLHHEKDTPFAVSHFTGHPRSASRSPHRYDHIYVSREFATDDCRCEYLQELRESGLSDHAPVIGTLRLR